MKKSKNLKRFVSFLLAFVLTLSAAGPVISTKASAASNSWPVLTSSCYAEYVAPANTNSLYQDYGMTVRGTLSPKLAYSSSISRGDSLILLGFTENEAGIIVSYPVGQTRRIAIVPTKTLLGASKPVEVFIAQASAPIYKITNSVSKWGSIAIGDMIYRAGSVTVNGCKYYLLVYEAASGSRGWKIGFLRASDLDAVKGTTSSQSNPSNADSSAVISRLKNIANGSLRYNDKTVLQVGKTFTGKRSNEECKGFGKNVFELLFGIVPGATQPREKGLNHLLYETSGITKLGSVTNLTPESISVLFAKARPGDFCQIRRNHGGSHSGIVYSTDSNGVTLYEANLDGCNTIYLCTYTWSDLCEKNAAMTLYTASNYR